MALHYSTSHYTAIAQGIWESSVLSGALPCKPTSGSKSGFFADPVTAYDSNTIHSLQDILLHLYFYKIPLYVAVKLCEITLNKATKQGEDFALSSFSPIYSLNI